MPMPVFSLIIATYGRVDTVDRLFASIAEQDEPQSDVQCILVDQNLDDRLAPTVEKWRALLDIHVIRCDPHSTSARNRGIEMATGDILAFPDDDCWFSPGLFHRIKSFFADHAHYDLLSIGVADGNGVASGNRWMQKRCEIVPMNVFRTSVTYACFFRRTPLTAAIRFDEAMGSRPNATLVGAEDTDFVLSALEAGVRGYFDRTLLVYHPRNDMLSGNVRPDRALIYGMGMGHTLRKYSLWALWISFLTYDFARAAICLASWRIKPFRLCLTHARGIWRGYRSTSPSPLGTDETSSAS